MVTKTKRLSKVCRKCHKRKKITSFAKQKVCGDGLAVWCRMCYKEYNAARYQADKVELARKSLEKYYAKKAEQNGPK